MLVQEKPDGKRNGAPLQRVLDGLDIETFVLCASEAEGRELMLTLLANLGFEDTDVVFVQHRGAGARVRARAYVHRPGVQHPFTGGARGQGEA